MVEGMGRGAVGGWCGVVRVVCLGLGLARGYGKERRVQPKPIFLSPPNRPLFFSHPLTPDLTIPFLVPRFTTIYCPYITDAILAPALGTGYNGVEEWGR